MSKETNINSTSEETEDVELLKQRLAELEQQLKNQTNPNKELNGDMPDADIDIRPDKYIQVMSLCPHPLNLSRNRGKPIRFSRFGESKRIIYSDLVDIIDNHPTFTEEGLYYIMNADVIHRHGLEDFYIDILKRFP